MDKLNEIVKKVLAEKKKKLEKEIAENNSKWITNIINNRIIKILKLNELRRMLNLRPYPKKIKKTSPTPLIFRDILQQAKQMVLGWNGKMYFVYLVYHQF